MAARHELFFEDVEIGDEIGPVKRVVTDDQVKEYISLWGVGTDPNRFTDGEVARREGLPGAMVPGAMNSAMMSQLLTGWSPSVILKKLDVVFRQVVLHDTPLRIKGIVTDKEVVMGEPRLECDVFMEDEEGSPLVIGRATVSLPSRSA